MRMWILENPDFSHFPSTHGTKLTPIPMSKTGNYSHSIFLDLQVQMPCNLRKLSIYFLDYHQNYFGSMGIDSGTFLPLQKT